MLFTTVAIVFFFSNYIHPEFGPLAFNACGYFGLAPVNEIFFPFHCSPSNIEATDFGDIH